jgi:hypothetical protein
VRPNLDGSAVAQSFIGGANGPEELAVDGTHIYWANYYAGTIGRAAIDGTGVNQAFITGASYPFGVAIDTSHVYWTNSAGNTVGRARLDGTAADQSFIIGANQPYGLAVDAAHVYWANYQSNAIARATLDGGAADQAFITGLSQPYGVDVDRSGLSSAPTATLTTPTADAHYSLGQNVISDYSCGAGVGGSDIVSCAGDVDGAPVAVGTSLPTDVAGGHTFTVIATDGAQNTTTVVHAYDVLAGSTSQSVSSGDAVTTDPGNVGATTDVPVQTAIAVPDGVAGTLSIALEDSGASSPSGYSFFAQQVQISGPAATASAPYEVVFSVDASLLAGVEPGDLQVFRNGAVIADCTDATAAVPDPCVVSRAPGPGGDAIITVRTSAFSTWNMASLRYVVNAFGAPIVAPPTINTATAGSSVSLRFSLGGNRGLNVFAAGYPRSALYTCGATAPSPTAGTAANGTLTYESSSGKYTYTWKTTKTMKGCRQITLRFRDGTIRTALFSLK